MTASAIYRGTVEHGRRAQARRRFRYRLYMLYLDLDEVERLFAGRWLWGHERLGVASFHRRDYLGDPRTPLREAVLDEVQAAAGRRPDGPVRMLTVPRCLGISFNPVTFYYCHDAAGRPDAVVAEITNTPWRERHRYVVARGDDGRLAARFDKQFHVSPFQPMQQTYEWWFSPPGDRLAIRMRNLEQDRAVFDAGLTMERRPWTAGELAKTLAVHPFLTAKVLFGIYFQALRTRLAGATFHPHPQRTEAEVQS
jgi:DUF1365 family protein